MDSHLKQLKLLKLVDKSERPVRQWIAKMYLVMLVTFFLFAVVAGFSPEEGVGKCQFTHDCRRKENQACNQIQDASCICNHGNCVIRGLHWFGPRKSECKTLQDCKKSGKCKLVPDNQCFCIEEQCETGTEWECHESRDCNSMVKCRGKECTCDDGTCEWNCDTDENCTNGPFYCDALGHHCKCQSSKCNLVKLPTQCKESSPNALQECVDKNFCKKDQACQCLQDYCTTPWYVEASIETPGGSTGIRNCRTTQDCSKTILDCANNACTCHNILEHKWNKRGTCVKNVASSQTNIDSKIKFPTN